MSSLASGRTAGFLSSDFVFLSKREYFEDVTRRFAAAKKGDRLLLVTHDFRPAEPLVADLMKAMAGAAERGANVQFALDERTYPVMQKVPISKNAATLIKATNETLATLKDAGATYAVTNKTFHRLINRFSGRAHIKVVIINDIVYVGGCNLTKASQIDFMIRWQNQSAADWLYDMMSRMIAAGSSQAAFNGHDHSFAVDSRTTLLLDSGKPHQSLIFDNALQLIDDAQEWLILTCQYYPISITGKRLHAAHLRSVDVDIYFNHPSVHQPGFNMMLHTAVLRERTRYPKKLFDKRLHKRMPYLHAKLLVSEKSTMIGSHNYVTIGVNFGTAELSLLRHDPEFSLKSRQFFEQLLVTSTTVPIEDQRSHL
ncbi:MAG TPA: phospholipase D-like domain-containing protein [Candidatus Saccharimonadales bacterium]|nr:phospholipase D-like domain-containing protein [Candidatus Saccharimonadales bacterium]